MAAEGRIRSIIANQHSCPICRRSRQLWSDTKVSVDTIVQLLASLSSVDIAACLFPWALAPVRKLR